MGETGQGALRVGFDPVIKLEFHGAQVSSDAGLFASRDLDEAAQLTESSAAELFDFRTGNNIRHAMTALLRQSVYSRLAGYEDVNDAERLRVDRRHLAEGCTHMTRRRRGQSNEGGRGAAGTTANPGINRLSGHSEDRFCLYSPSDVVQRSILCVHSPGIGLEGRAFFPRR